MYDALSGKDSFLKKRISIIITALFIVIAGFIYIFNYYSGKELRDYGQKERTTEEGIPSAKDISPSSEAWEASTPWLETEEYCVFLCGEVQREGVYYLAKGARIDDAILAAGGFTDSADRSYWNLAAFIYDGQQIYVPAKGELSMPVKEQSHYDSYGRLDLNTATLSELVALSGIGEKRARDILSYRDKVGRFESIEQLMNISGIKGSTFSDIKDYIFVR